MHRQWGAPCKMTFLATRVIADLVDPLPGVRGAEPGCCVGPVLDRKGLKQEGLEEVSIFQA